MADRSDFTILVVEDNPTASKLFTITLEAEGYRVLSALDAKSALEHLSRETPALVLQDLLLPDMEGLALLRAIRALPEGQRLPVIAISGFKTLLEHAAGQPGGFDATLAKPVQPSALIELIRRYVDPPSRDDDPFGVEKTVLIVDDDPVQLKLSRLRLEHAGFSVMTAGDADSALRMASDRPPDVIVCDVLMPGMDGYELCRAFKNVPALGAVPVVLVSAHYGGARDEALARSVGATTLVTRSPELETILDAVRDALAPGPETGPVPADPPEFSKSEHTDRVVAQLERQVHASAGFAAKSALQAAQLSILAGIADALLRSDDVEVAFEDVLTACLDAGGISRGALYRTDEHEKLVLTKAIGFPAAPLDALDSAFGCSHHVTHAGVGVVVSASTCLSEAEARENFAAAGLVAAVFIPFMEGPRCIGALLLGSSTTEMDERDLVSFARAIGAHISQALALTDSFSRLRDAAEAGRVLSASLDLDETLAALSRLATARLADVCEITLAGEAPRSFGSVGVGSGGASSVGVGSVDVGSVGVSDDAGGPPTPRNEIVVELGARGRTLGTVSFVRARDARPFTASDQVAAEDLTNRAAIAIDNAALYKTAQELSRVKDEFLATVSHELRTPLTSILGWARMLSAGLAGTKRDHAYRVIERNATSQAQLIEDLLDTSRIISGQMRLDLKPIHLERVIEAATESLKPALDAKRIHFRRSTPEVPIRIMGDAARLQQVIWNLLANAVKFTPSGGHIDVAAALSGDYATVTVADDGQGIDLASQSAVFERFQQADSGISRSQGGLGLGLAITRHLVELHGGTITLHSAGRGCGCTFVVELPLAERQSDEIAVPAVDSTELDAPSELANVRILVVDDDEDTREVLVAALESCGAKATGAASASEALDVLTRDRPDVLLSDIGMPGEDGYSLIRRVRNLPSTEGGSIPAAAITAYNRSEDRLLALAAGFQMHLAKPLELSMLIAAAVSLARMSVNAKLL